MKSPSIQAIVLAAGKSTRFNTGRTKLLERLCGQEMILYTTKLLESLNLPTTLVLGYEADAIKKIVTAHHPALTIAHQEEQKGTGHALMCSQTLWHADHLLVMNGDMPLVTESIIEELITKHTESNADVSFVVSHCDHPVAAGYGRVIETNGKIKIIEEKDLKTAATESCCINAGIYIFKKSFAQDFLSTLQTENASNEYYLTDLIEKANNVITIQAPFDTIRGINTLKELWSAEQIKRAELISMWMERGVRFFAAQAAHVDVNVSIGKGTVISYGAHIINGTVLGANCVIEPFAVIDNCTLSESVIVYSHSVLRDSTIESNAQIGPFAHIRGKSIIKQTAVVGNFVELKATSLGVASKAKHLAYLGDARIGEHANIGAGTITCNHNGISKNQTTIEDFAYIGSNSTLIAPVTIGKNAYTAAGSVITKQVPADSLAIARAYQINKEGYAAKLRKKFAQGEDKPKDTGNETEQVSFVGALKTHNDSALSGNT
ncbi:bifunctional UDP-N-acetylglucosamine diphosphorylase/glucosamine-1-phosphate N-acetyltransferase GlmU [Candidatus Dependentiae bacterium]|nr:bifunctional UDP-N-acetylglucosamine diphosphorylase/glucosamine-1-phosphate N-acetyltransferase GlmU [Candidatus Dependentiae bacterium]